MPLYCAYSAGEFLEEALEYKDIPADGIEIYNPNSKYPYEWWTPDLKGYINNNEEIIIDICPLKLSK